MPIPTWSPGEVLASNDVNQWFVPQAAIRTTDSAQQKSTTLTNDTTLLFPMVANAIYEWRLYLIYSGSATGGFKWAASVPSGATGSYMWINYNAGGSGSSATNVVTNPYTVTIGTLDALYYFQAWGQVICGTTAGNFQIQYAENASDASNGSFIRADSFLTAQRLA